MKMSNLYIVIFPNYDCFKIGKADNIVNRINVLSPIWGKPDYKNSYHIEITSDKVLKIEKGLHLFLDDFKLNTLKKDGYTELFRMDGLGVALKYIDIYLNNNGLKITKGLDEKKFIKEKKAIDRHKRRKLEDAFGMHMHMNNIKFDFDDYRNFHNMYSKHMYFLVRNYDKINYQHNVKESSIEFYILLRKYNKKYVLDMENHKINTGSSIFNSNKSKDFLNSLKGMTYWFTISGIKYKLEGIREDDFLIEKITIYKPSKRDYTMLYQVLVYDFMNKDIKKIPKISPSLSFDLDKRYNELKTKSY